MNLPFMKKKTAEQIEIDRQAEEIRLKAETKERLKLAKEHGKADALKKYGKFNEPSVLGSILKAGKDMAYAGETPNAKKPKKPKRDINKMFEDLARL